VETVPFTGDPDSRAMNEVLAQFDAPAYIRRAAAVESTLAHLLAKCRAHREEMLAMVKLHLGQLWALAGGPDALRPLLADDEQLAVLEGLRAGLSPRLRLPPGPTRSRRTLVRALRALGESIGRFNARWQAYLEKVDLAAVNKVREGYNKHYVLEKACFLRNDVLANRGFVPLPPLTPADLAGLLPPLPAPRPAGTTR
jgi:hypothetical protein